MLAGPRTRCIACCAMAALASGCGQTRIAPKQTSAHDAPNLVCAPDSGLHYTWRIPGSRPLNILQALGNGCAFLDYDNDGRLDILLVGPRLALFKGDGRGHFTDVSHETWI